MKDTLAALLDGAIDYAGLFPPAQLDMAAAVKEYSQMLAKHEWIVNRFIVPVSRIEELIDAKRRLQSEEPIYLSLTLSPITEGRQAPASLDRDIDLMSSLGDMEISGCEIRLPAGDELRGAVKALEKRRHRFENMDFCVELPWTADLGEGIHEVTADVEDVVLKARTGGVLADDFPSVPALAEFIWEAVAMEAMVKFTAGLHEPIRHHDAKLGIHRHGFLNVLGAAALASQLDLTVREIEAILILESPSDFRFEDEVAIIGGHEIGVEALDGWREEWFAGFGSCSVIEPIEGLKRLGLLP